MLSLLTPPRIRGEEILDGENVDPRVMTQSISDVAKANALFGGVSAVLSEIDIAIPSLPRDASLLDVATGVGDIPLAATKHLRRHGIGLATFGLDASEALAVVGRQILTATIRGDALRLPFATNSVDIVTTSQFLHHMLPDEASILIREMNRVARVRVIISDIRRSWVAAGGLWAVSFPLRFHPVSRHDGVVSVMRGFTAAELSGIVSDAMGVPIAAKRRHGFRVTAGWIPSP
ncbi:MAG: methyltransferase domain-containing protein [Gemmatimonadaceae bacterium]|nr:methyltransferase domain-containing protein [Gemmatimonadaceae bacterium]